MKRIAVFVGLLLGVLLVPAPASAHPLGKFSVNQAIALSFATDSVTASISLDFAELPTLAAKPTADLSGRATCESFRSTLSVTGARFSVVSSSFAYEPGSAGLSTSRVSCTLQSPLTLRAGSVVAVSNEYLPDRVGWREITATGSGLSLATALPSASPSGLLRDYPADLLSSPLDVRSGTVRITGLSPAGSAADLCSDPDTGSRAGAVSASAPGAGSGSAAGSAPDTGSGPGTGFSCTAGSDSGAASGSGSDGGSEPASSFSGWTAGFERRLDALVGSTNLTPVAGLLAVLLSLVLGAAHAALPGHGKTVMAAYLAGRDGRPRDAFTVGATVTLTHTGGVLLLGLALTGVASLAGERVLSALGIASGALIAIVGLALLVRSLRGRGSLDSHAHSHAHGPDHTHIHGPAHIHEPDAHGSDGHAHPGDHPHGLDQARSHRHGLGHSHRHPHGHSHDHSHGHVHGTTTGRRSGRDRLGVIGLGVAGGLVPSPTALLVLLGAIGFGRTAFGVALVLAYGLGMAATLTAAGLLLVRLRHTVLDRPVFARLRSALPLTTSGLILLVGLGMAVRAGAAFV